MTTLRIGSLKTEKVNEKTIRRKLKVAREDETIEEIHFWKIDVSQTVLKDISKLLIRDGRRFRSIKLLSCTGHVKAIVTMIMDYNSVDTLVLSGSQIEEDTLLAVNQGLRTNQSIKTLRILGAQFVNEHVDFLEGLSRNCTLAELDLARSHLAPGVVKSLCRALSQNRHLQMLKLEQCGLEDQGMAEIIHALLENSSIRELDLSDNSAHSAALKALAGLIRNSDVLRSLNLSHQILTEELDLLSLNDAVVALRSNTTLQNLDVSGNQFKDEAVEVLAACLSSNTTLKCLDVSESHITEHGIEIFAHQLPQFCGLATLNISGNAMSERAVESLVQGLKDNRILQSLGPVDTSYSCSHMMEHYLDLNIAGRRAMQNDIPIAVWPQLLARAGCMSDNDCGRNENAIYSLLRGPALFVR